MSCPIGCAGRYNPRKKQAVQTSKWPKIHEVRQQFAGVRVKTELVYDPPSVNRTKDKKTGQVTESLTGGPYIEVKPTAYYSSKKGRKIPVVKASLFTWTSKMSCPSFGLAAGPGRFMGTCKAASEEVVERDGGYLDFAEPLSGRPEGEDYICDLCYAGKNNYLTFPSTAIAQVIRRIWVDQAISEGAFVEEMKSAILALEHPKAIELLDAKKVSRKFFRIHDSGDFVTTSYYRAWVRVCQDLRGMVKFWAPTRLWVFRKWREVFEKYPAPSNLALRPSALTLFSPPPQIPGLDSGSTSAKQDMGDSIWDCPAYKSDDSYSCVDAKCRVCWGKKKEVSYLTH